MHISGAETRWKIAFSRTEHAGKWDFCILPAWRYVEKHVFARGARGRLWGFFCFFGRGFFNESFLLFEKKHTFFRILVLLLLVLDEIGNEAINNEWVTTFQFEIECVR